MTPADTIAAISSGIGPPAARAIVRLSGGRAHRIARGLSELLPQPGLARQAHLCFAGLTVPA